LLGDLCDELVVFFAGHVSVFPISNLRSQVRNRSCLPGES
jgi:hypothetical protein